MQCWRLTFLLLLAATGCLWRGYAAIMAVHLDVLTQMAAKLSAVVETKRGVTTEGMAEYTYPAKRAREFLQQFDSYRARRSYQQFSTLLDRYEALVRAVDAARAQGQQSSAAAHAAAERDALQQLAAEIRADLQAGR